MPRDDHIPAPHGRVEVRCVECRVPGSAESVSLLRATGWRQRDNGAWVCPRCTRRLARAS